MLSEITVHALALMRGVYLISTHTHFLNFHFKSIIDINVCATYSSWDKIMLYDEELFLFRLKAARQQILISSQKLEVKISSLLSLTCSSIFG